MIIKITHHWKLCSSRWLTVSIVGWRGTRGNGCIASSIWRTCMHTLILNMILIMEWCKNSSPNIWKPAAMCYGVLWGCVTPSCATLGCVTPGCVTPGCVNPGCVIPGCMNPGCVTPGCVTPGCVIPGCGNGWNKCPTGRLAEPLLPIMIEHCNTHVPSKRERERESVCHVIARHVWHCPCTEPLIKCLLRKKEREREREKWWLIPDVRCFLAISSASAGLPPPTRLPTASLSFCHVGGPCVSTSYCRLSHSSSTWVSACAISSECICWIASSAPGCTPSSMPRLLYLALMFTSSRHTS